MLLLTSLQSEEPQKVRPSSAPQSGVEEGEFRDDGERELFVGVSLAPGLAVIPIWTGAKGIYETWDISSWIDVLNIILISIIGAGIVIMVGFRLFPKEEPFFSFSLVLRLLFLLIVAVLATAIIFVYILLAFYEHLSI